MSNARTRTLKTLMKGREKFKRGILSDKERLDPHGRKWSLVRGDKVQVVHRRHAEFGKSGTILQIDRRRDRVKVEGKFRYFDLLFITNFYEENAAQSSRFFC